MTGSSSRKTNRCYKNWKY